MDETYRTDKITRVLTMYYRLFNSKHIDKTAFSIEHGISERSVDRDIEDIRLFLSEMFLRDEVVFDKTSNTYYLTGDKPNYMDRMETTIILKLILSSGAFRKDEMAGIFKSLLQTVNSKDKKTINEYLEQDKQRYKSNHENAILKILGDLYVVINNGNDIEVLIRDNNNIEKIKISPIEINYNGRFFYLIAAKNFELSEIIRIRIDKINSYKILGTNYAKTLKIKYKDFKEE